MNRSIFVITCLVAMAAAPLSAEVRKGATSSEHSKLSRMDTDNDHMVSRDEFMKHCQERFAKLDADGDGKLNQDEQQRMARAMTDEANDDRSRTAKSGQHASAHGS